MQVPFSRPAIDEADIEAVVETLRSGWLTTGAAATRLEDEFRRISGAPQALAVSSATAALHLALVAWRVGQGDEVILPALTFASCAGVVIEAGATPVLADVREDDLTIDPKAVEGLVTARTRVIMPVHYGGQPARMDQIGGLANGEIHVLEDAAHAPGAKYDGAPVGSLGDAASFSLYATKNVTSGEGGVLTANDEDFIERARMLSLHGMSRDAWRRYAASGGSWRYEVEERGFKYNLSDILAALGVSQAARLNELNAERARIAGLYASRLAEVEAVDLPVVRPEVQHAWHLFVVKLRLEQLGIDRGRFIELLRERGVGTSVHFIPVHHHPAYAELRRGDLSVTDQVFERLISLPIYPGLSDVEVAYVVESIEEIARGNRR